MIDIIQQNGALIESPFKSMVLTEVTGQVKGSSCNHFNHTFAIPSSPNDSDLGSFEYRSTILSFIVSYKYIYVGTIFSIWHQLVLPYYSKLFKLFEYL